MKVEMNESKDENQFVKVWFKKDAGATVEANIDAGNLAYSIGQLIIMMSDMTKVSQEKCMASILHANKNTPEH